MSLGIILLHSLVLLVIKGENVFEVYPEVWLLNDLNYVQKTEWIKQLPIDSIFLGLTVPH